MSMHVRTLLLAPAEQRSRASHVSLFWSEKLWTLLIYFQNFALLWVLSLSWPWPSQFLTWTCFSLVATLDLPPLVQQQQFGLSASASYWTLLHIIVLLLLPLALFAWAVALERRVEARGDTTALGIHATRRVLCALADFLYTPVLVALGRLLLCDSSSSTAAAPSDSLLFATGAPLTCYAWPHVALIAVLAPFPLVAAFAWPRFVHRLTSELVLYSTPIEHERWLQSRETEHVLGLTEQYEHTPTFLLASYSRRFANFHAWQYAPRLILVVALFALSPTAVARLASVASSSSSTVSSTTLSTVAVLQASVFIAVHLGSLLLHFFLGLYRCASSTHFHLALAGVLTADAFFGLMSAVQYRSAFTVDSVLSVLLIVIQGAGWLALALMAVYHGSKANRALHSWPVTLEKINRWAESSAALSAGGAANGGEGDTAADMIGTLRAARLALEQAPSIPLELYPIAGTMQLLFQLTRYRKQLMARRTAGEGGGGSLAIEMESVAPASSSSLTDNSRRAVAALRGGAADPLSPAAASSSSSVAAAVGGAQSSSAQPHILEWSVQDAADDVAQLVSRASRRTLLPNQLLERALDGMQTAMAVKARQHALMHPTKRRILLKLLAVHALRGGDEYEQQPSQYDELPAPLPLPLQQPADNALSIAASLHMSLPSHGGRSRMSALATVAEQAGGEEEDEEDELSAFLDR